MTLKVSAYRGAAGLSWGLVATVPMTALMLIAVRAGVAPMPKPIPAALVAQTLGPLPKPGVLALGLVAHFAYGAVAGSVLAVLSSRVRFWQALGWAVGLWLVMGLVWLPYLGWGLFGTAQAVPIAVATLVLHLVYGVTLGALFAWRPEGPPVVTQRPVPGPSAGQHRAGHDARS